MATAPISPLSDSAAQLVSALTTGDKRIQSSFRVALARAVAHNDPANSLRAEELEALVGVTAGAEDSHDDEFRKTLAPTLRHLLARVL